jgi:hypothetical protein
MRRASLMTWAAVRGKTYQRYEEVPAGTDEASVRAYTLRVLAFYGLADWRVVFDNARRRLGVCRYREKAVGFSRYFLRGATAEHVRQVALHEVAHALTPGCHHSDAWLHVARQMGYEGARTCGVMAGAPPARWQATCPCCRVVCKRFKTPKTMDGWHCRKCGRDRGKLAWVDMRAAAS